MIKFSDSYRIDSTRIHNWHYASPGKYFITICTRSADHYFGEIVNGIMVLNSLGKEVVNQWVSTPDIRPDMNISLDVFQVMPNHFHGIIEIGWNRFNHKNIFPIYPCRDGMHAVSTRINLGMVRHDINHSNKFGPQIKNLGSIMRGFKSSVTTFARKNKLLFDWQPRYFDVLIQNECMLQKIRQYILNNVKNWEQDRFYNNDPNENNGE